LKLYAEAKLQARLKKVSATMRRAAKHPEDTENIHDLRVAIRRLTQGLRAFKDLLDRGHARKMRRTLKKTMDLCGAARNCDVARDVLRAAGAPVKERLDRRLAKTRSQAERELSDHLTDSTRAKVKKWDGWLRAKPGPTQTIASAARRALVPLAAQFFRARARAAKRESTTEDMHRFRLRAKRLRYTLEVFGPVAGAKWSQMVQEIRALQERLGAINDCAVTRDMIADPSDRGARARRSEAALERLLRDRIQALREYLDGNSGAETERLWLDELKKIE
jgi:CHAD domain-containing protein